MRAARLFPAAARVLPHKARRPGPTRLRCAVLRVWRCAPARIAKREGLRNVVWLVPVFVLYAAGLVLPLGITVQRAFELGVTGWGSLLHNSLFTGAARNTAIDAAEITFIAVILAYSVAAAIWRSGPIARALLIILVLVPFLTTVLVKIVAFDALLRNNGVL